MKLTKNPDETTKIFVDFETGYLHCQEEGQPEVKIKLKKGITPNQAAVELRAYVRAWNRTKSKINF